MGLTWRGGREPAKGAMHVVLRASSAAVAGSYASFWFARTGSSGDGEGESGTGRKLLQAQVLFRHGARTPIFPSLPNGRDALWNHCAHHQGVDVADVKFCGFAGGPQPIFSELTTRSLQEFYRGGCTVGELTDVGQFQCEALGQRIRKHYPDLARAVSSDPSTLYVRSTNYPRTRMSAACVVTGLVTGLSADGGRSLSGPIQIECKGPDDEDMIGNNTRVCDAMGDILKQAQATFGADPPDGVKDYIEATRERLGADMARRIAINKESTWNGYNGIPTFDLLNCLKAHGKSAPAWCSFDTFHEMKKVASLQMSEIIQGPHRGAADPTWRTRVARLGIGSFLGSVQQKMESRMKYRPEAASIEDRSSAQDGSSEAASIEDRSSDASIEDRSSETAFSSKDRTPNKEKTLVLYSGHDTSIATTLAAYGVYGDREWPDFCSSVAWELYEEPRARASTEPPQYSVRMLYDFEPVLLPGQTSEYVPYEEFARINNRLIPKDREKECVGNSLYSMACYRFRKIVPFFR